MNTATPEGCGQKAVKERRHVRMFKPEFAPLVERGSKNCTIRPKPKTAIRRGDRLSLREWTGRPYASKQRVLRETVCTACLDIEIISENCIRVDGDVLSATESDALAHADGFCDTEDLFFFFQDEYALPFSGVLIKWERP